MGTIERFEDIQAWQRARALNRKFYDITGNRAFARDFSLKDQIRRAALSIMLNIAEGFARRSNKDFKYFLFVAHGSASEVQSALYVAKDQNYITESEFQTLYQDTEEVPKMIAGFVKYLGKWNELRKV